MVSKAFITQIETKAEEKTLLIKKKIVFIIFAVQSF